MPTEKFPPTRFPVWPLNPGSSHLICCTVVCGLERQRSQCQRQGRVWECAQLVNRNVCGGRIAPASPKPCRGPPAQHPAQLSPGALLLRGLHDCGRKAGRAPVRGTPGPWLVRLRRRLVMCQVLPPAAAGQHRRTPACLMLCTPCQASPCGRHRNTKHMHPQQPGRQLRWRPCQGGAPCPGGTLWQRVPRTGFSGPVPRK